MVFAGYALILSWAALCGWGAIEVQNGMSGPYLLSGGWPGFAGETARAAEIHLGISWLVGVLACGVFMLAFPTLGPPGWRLRGGWR